MNNLVELLRWRANHQPKKLAYRFLEDGETDTGGLTYSQLDQQVRALAAKLQQILAVGDRALLLYPAGLEFVVAFLGCLYAGVIAVPAYPPRRNQNLNRLQSILHDCQAGVVLTTASLRKDILSQFAEEQTISASVCLASDEIALNGSDQWNPIQITAQTIAFLQYTSGSTGAPKGVRVTHHNLWYNQRMIAKGLEHGEHTVFVSWLPLFHDMGLVGNFLQSLYLGVPCTLMSPVAFLQKPFRWLQAVSRYRATTSGGPNFAFDLCVKRVTSEQLKELDLSSWQIAFNGAEPVQASTLRDFSQTFAPCGFRWEAFYPCYGMAETTLFVTGGLVKAPPVIQPVEAKELTANKVSPGLDATQPGYREIVGCGRLWLDEQVNIVDPETQAPCSPNEIGEIWIAGEHVADGYWGQPEESEATFKAKILGNLQQSFLRTGDLGFYRQGELFITGRLKDVVIVRGQNHYPQDIELTVQRSHPALRSNSGAAFSIDVERSGEQLVIVQEVERTYLRKLPQTEKEIIENICLAVSQEHELQVYSVQLLKPFSLPKTSSGKVQRYACRQAYLQGSTQQVASWHASATLSSLPSAERSLQVASGEGRGANQEEIAKWLANYLAHSLQTLPSHIDRNKAFASYGLDSAVAVSMTSDLSEWLGLELEAILLWEYPTIAEVSNYLATQTVAKVYAGR